MKEILITSSALIAVIVLLRTLLKGKISLRLQYALWLLVALRLLIPVSLFASPVSVLNAVEPVRSAISAAVPKTPAAAITPGNVQGIQGGAGASGANGAVTSPGVTTPIAPEGKWPDMAALLPAVWLAGMGAVGLWFVVADLRFRRKLKRSAKQLRGMDCPLTVRVTAAVPSPCLYGVLRPAIYLTPDCLENEAALRHVLAHEETHYRHGDQFWSLARCVCLAVYWFNPLVWLAAALSRWDCELACDEGAIRRLGEVERISYGRTLLSMVVPENSPADLLRTATTMTSGKGGLRERIALIAKKPKAAAVTVIAVVLIAAVAVGCTFTGAQVSETPDMPLEEALTILPDELKDSVVLKAKEELAEGTLLEAFYKEDYGTDWGGGLLLVWRVTPVVFEKNYAFNTGGVEPLARDADWYYVLYSYSPTEVNDSPEHQERYRVAQQAAQAWVKGIFANQSGLTAMEDDPSYQAINAEVSYPGRHVDVSYKPYYGLEHYPEGQEDEAYRLVLSQPVRQGEGGIWCVDHWYYKEGQYLPYIPDAQVTIAEYYAMLQENADKGEETWRLDPLQVSMDFVEYMFEVEGRPAEAFSIGEVYEGDVPADTAVGLKPSLFSGGDGIAVLAMEWRAGADGTQTNTKTVSYPLAQGSILLFGTYELTYMGTDDLTPAEYDYAITLNDAGSTVANGADGRWLKCFAGSDMAFYHSPEGEGWYRASPKAEGGDSLVQLLRGWFDYALRNESENYEPLYIEEAKATLLLPKSWIGNYVVEKRAGVSGFYLTQKDFLAGEWGIREDGTEGPVPFGDGGFVSLIGFDVQEKEDYLATFGRIGGHNGLWLGERDGLYYLIWFPTSFSSGDTVDAEAKAELYKKLMDDIMAYPSDASAYFIFDE